MKKLYYRIISFFLAVVMVVSLAVCPKVPVRASGALTLTALYTLITTVCVSLLGYNYVSRDSDNALSIDEEIRALLQNDADMSRSIENVFNSLVLSTGKIQLPRGFISKVCDFLKSKLSSLSYKNIAVPVAESFVDKVDYGINHLQGVYDGFVDDLKTLMPDADLKDYYYSLRALKNYNHYEYIVAIPKGYSLIAGLNVVVESALLKTASAKYADEGYSSVKAYLQAVGKTPISFAINAAARKIEEIAFDKIANAYGTVATVNYTEAIEEEDDVIAGSVSETGQAVNAIRAEKVRPAVKSVDTPIASTVDATSDIVINYDVDALTQALEGADLKIRMDALEVVGMEGIANDLSDVSNNTAVANTWLEKIFIAVQGIASPIVDAINNVLDALSSFWDKLLEFLKRLFIPNTLRLKASVDDFKSKLSTHFSILSYPLVNMIRFLGRCTKITVQDFILHIPQIRILDYVLIDETYVNVTELLSGDLYGSLYAKYLTVSRYLMIFGVLSLAGNKFKVLIRGF